MWLHICCSTHYLWTSLWCRMWRFNIWYTQRSTHISTNAWGKINFQPTFMHSFIITSRGEGCNIFFVVYYIDSLKSIYIFLDGYETQYIKIGFKKWQNIRQNMTNEIQSLKTIKICKNLMIWYFYNLYKDVCFIVFSMEAVDNMLHYVPLFCFLSRSILLHPSLLSLCILNPHIIFIADKNTGNLLTTCF